MSDAGRTLWADLSGAQEDTAKVYATARYLYAQGDHLRAAKVQRAAFWLSALDRANTGVVLDIHDHEATNEVLDLALGVSVDDVAFAMNLTQEITDA